MALADIGSDLGNIAPGATLEPVAQLAGDQLVGLFAGPMRQVDDKSVSVGDHEPFGIGTTNDQRHLPAPVGDLRACHEAWHGMATGGDPLKNRTGQTPYP